MPMQLDSDLIRSIAVMNASDNAFDKQHRLTVTRNTSQVCRRWRQAVLECSLLWGRLILLDEHQSAEWIDEVLKRSGTLSLLWIEFNTDGKTTSGNSRRLLSSLFGILQNWDRIEVLHIISKNVLVQANSPYKQIWENMTKAAPMLRSFRITDPLATDAHPTTLPNTLFANHAPILRRLSCYGSCVSPQAQWIPYLETLRFTPRSLDDISAMLIEARSLQKLGIKAAHNCFSADTEAHLSVLKSMSISLLPHLSYFDANMSLPAFTALWSASSSTPAKYSIKLSVGTGNSQTDRVEAQQLSDALSNVFYHNNILTEDLSEPTRWSLHIQSLHIQIQALSASRIVFDLKFLGRQSTTMVFLFKCCVQYLIDATDFLLNISLLSQFPLKDLEDALLLMNGVKTITVNRNSIKLYDTIERSGSLLFPQLKMVKFRGDIQETDEYRNLFLVFFLRRVQAGRTLPFVHPGASVTEHIISDLNRISGPRVRWSLSNKWSDDRELHWKYL